MNLLRKLRAQGMPPNAVNDSRSWIAGISVNRGSANLANPATPENTQTSPMHPNTLISRQPLLILCTLFLSTATVRSAEPELGEFVSRTGDEIVVCGQMVHTTLPIVKLWLDPGGYDAYRVERRFSPWERASWAHSNEDAEHLDTPNRYGIRKDGLTPEQIEQVRGGGWTLEQLQKVVDQFVIHYDVCGTSRRCFEVLHDHRGLSVHFLLDVDGTIYQTLDLKERAWHATISNARSIGIEIANIGAYPEAKKNVLRQWYQDDNESLIRLTLPKQEIEFVRKWEPDFVIRPMRNELVKGTIQGIELYQYDFTPQQYAALIKLTATLCKVFPKIRPDFPKDESGNLVPHKLDDDVLRNYNGLIGHYHIQTNKTDPGPAFQWEYVTEEVQRILAD